MSRRRVSEPRLAVVGRTVLVIEDEDGVRELTARILGERSHRVLVARSAMRLSASWTGSRATWT